MKKKDYSYWLDCDFVPGACDCYENAVKHFDTSNYLACHNNFGFAVSHLVLGAEELIKALVLVKLHTEPYFIDDVQKEELFRNHSFKHINIREFLQALTPDELHDYFESWYDMIGAAEQKNKFRKTGFFLSRTLQLGEIGEEDILEIEHLIQQANDFKNKGLYVDYRNNWQTPNDIEEKTFLQFNGLIQKLRQFIEPIFKTPLGDNEVTEFIYGS